MKSELKEEILHNLKNNRSYKIAFIGDSLTSCEWVHPNWRDIFEYVLKFSLAEEFDESDWWIPEWNLKFYNYALDGASTRDFISQFELAQNEVSPDLFIIMGTINDAELGITVNEHFVNLNNIFNKINSLSKLCVYSPDISIADENHNKISEPYINKVLSTKYPSSITIVNGFEIYKNYPIRKFFTLESTDIPGFVGVNAVDNVHPNVLGNIYIAKMFLEEAFGIIINAEKYFKDVKSDKVKYPRWK